MSNPNTLGIMTIEMDLTNKTNCSCLSFDGINICHSLFGNIFLFLLFEGLTITI